MSTTQERNSNGAAGYFYLDTTTVSNGMHTIGWLASDNNGRAAGIGSRFFWVLNQAESSARQPKTG